MSSATTASKEHSLITPLWCNSSERLKHGSRLKNRRAATPRHGSRLKNRHAAMPRHDAGLKNRRTAMPRYVLLSKRVFASLRKNCVACGGSSVPNRQYDRHSRSETSVLVHPCDHHPISHSRRPRLLMRPQNTAMAAMANGIISTVDISAMSSKIVVSSSRKRSTRWIGLWLKRLAKKR